MSKHMQEPWPPFIDICEPATPHPDSDGVVALGFDDYRRAKACVNALTGVPTEWVEKFSISGSENVAQENARLTMELDDLLAVMEATVKAWEIGSDIVGGMMKAKAVIAKAKGIDHE